MKTFLWLEMIKLVFKIPKCLCPLNTARSDHKLRLPNLIDLHQPVTKLMKPFSIVTYVDLESYSTIENRFIRLTTCGAS